MSINRITKLLERSSSQERNFPPTDLYNEGWMLRLVLDWLSYNPGIEHELSFMSWPHDTLL